MGPSPATVPRRARGRGARRPAAAVEVLQCPAPDRAAPDQRGRTDDTARPADSGGGAARCWAEFLFLYNVDDWQRVLHGESINLEFSFRRERTRRSQADGHSRQGIPGDVVLASARDRDHDRRREADPRDLRPFVRHRRLRASHRVGPVRPAGRGVQHRGDGLPRHRPAWLLRGDQHRHPGRHGDRCLAADAEVRHTRRWPQLARRAVARRRRQHPGLPQPGPGCAAMNTTTSLASADRPATAPRGPGEAAGRRRRRRDNTSLTVTRIATFDEAAALVDDWQALYSVSARGNPFASPDWLLTWARHFVPERDLEIFAVRRGPA